jgi:hypothetical protein
MSPARRRPARRPPQPQASQREADDPPAPQRDVDDPQTLQREAEEQVRRTSQALRAHPLPATSEPSFFFRP